MSVGIPGPIEDVAASIVIVIVRSHKVMLDSTLATLLINNK